MSIYNLVRIIILLLCATLILIIFILLDMQYGEVYAQLYAQYFLSFGISFGYAHGYYIRFVEKKDYWTVFSKKSIKAGLIAGIIGIVLFHIYMVLFPPDGVVDFLLFFTVGYAFLSCFGILVSFCISVIE